MIGTTNRTAGRWQRLRTIASACAALAFVLTAMLPIEASAAGQLTARSLTLSTSASGASATYTFGFNVATSGTAVKSWQAQICTTASGTCTTPGGFVNSSSTINQPTGLGAASGWTVNTSTAGSLRMLNASNATNPSASSTVVFNSVTNSTSVATFFARITTYSDSAWTTPIDSGTVSNAVSNTITVNASVDESLTFCVYNTGGACTDTSTSPVQLGTLSTSTASTGTSQLGAATNAGSGLSISYTGSTLTSGVNTIAAIGGSAAASSPGTAQFGINLVANTSPSVGANVTGTAPIGAAASPYATTNTFAFVPGSTAQTVASSAGPINLSNFTVSYLANIAGVTKPGAYTTTLTYLCTATY